MGTAAAVLRHGRFTRKVNLVRNPENENLKLVSSLKPQNDS